MLQKAGAHSVFRPWFNALVDFDSGFWILRRSVRDTFLKPKAQQLTTINNFGPTKQVWKQIANYCFGHQGFPGQDREGVDLVKCVFVITDEAV